MFLCGNAQFIKLNNIERSNTLYNFLSISEPFDGYIGLTDTNGIQRYAHVDTLLIRDIYADGDSLCFVFFDTTLCVDGVIGGSMSDKNLFEDNITGDGLDHTHNQRGNAIEIDSVLSWLWNTGVTNERMVFDTTQFLVRIGENNTYAEIKASVIAGVPTITFDSRDGVVLPRSSFSVIPGEYNVTTLGPLGEVSQLKQSANDDLFELTTSGTMQIQSISQDYILGDGAGAFLPPSGALTDSIATIRPSDGQIRMIHPDRLSGGGDETVNIGDEDQIPFVNELGTDLEYHDNFMFINNDSLVLESSLTINGISGLTPTTVKVLKSGMIEQSQVLNDEGYWYTRRIKDLEQDRGNISYSEYIGSTAFSGYRNDFTFQDGFNAGIGGTAEVDSLPGFYRSREYEYAQDATHTFSELHELFYRNSKQYRLESYIIDWDRPNDWYHYLTTSRHFLNDPVQFGLANNFPYFSITPNDSTGMFMDMYSSGADEGFRWFSWPDDARIQLLNHGVPGVVTLDIFQDEPFSSIVNLEYLNYEPSLAAATSIAGRDAAGFITGATIGTGLALTAGVLSATAFEGGGDSIVTCFNGDIGFIEMGDTTCVSTDSVYQIEPCTYFIIMNDTVEVCIPSGTPGLNIANSNLSMTNTPGGVRLFNLDTASLHLRRGTSDRFVINNDFATSIVMIRGGSGTVKPQLQIRSNNLETGGAGIHLSGLTDGTHIRDYSMWMNPAGSGSFQMYEQSTPSDAFFTYYGFLDSIVIPKQIQFNARVLDSDGDIGSLGQVFSAKADGTGDWTAAGGAGPIPINDLLDADGTNSIDNTNLSQTWDWSTEDATGLRLSMLSNTAAASDAQKVLEIDLTGANANSGQDSYGVHVQNAHTGTSSTNYSGYFASSGGSNNYGVLGIGSSAGIWGQTTAGGIAVYANAAGAGAAGLYATSPDGSAITATGGVASTHYLTTAGTNDVAENFRFIRASTGTAANGIGLSVNFAIQTTTTAEVAAGNISSLWTTATHATRTSAIDFYTVNSASLARKMRIAGNGQITHDTYGDGTHTGTITKRPGYDVDGNIVEENGYAVLANGRPISSFTNSTTSDQDFTALHTLLASHLTADRTIRVTILYETVTGVSTATAAIYFKLGTTKVYIPTAADFNNSLTRSGSISIDITGTAAAGASVAVHTGLLAFPFYAPANSINTVSYSQTQATNGTLALTAGVTYSATGSTETLTLVNFKVEQLN